MEYLKFILFSFILLSCSVINMGKPQALKPKFRFGDQVAILDNNFYNECYGRIVNYHWDLGVIYEVDLFCRSFDSKYSNSRRALFSEKDLIGDMSEH